MAFTESFDRGVGIFSNTWGNVDTSVRGQITLRGDSGAMEPYWGASSGHGYGTYEVVASMSADQAGPAALLWPSDGRWPGAEFDIVEVVNGRPYGTVHYDNNGRDGWQSVFFDGVDETDINTYTLEWRPDEISYSVNGEHMGSVRSNVGESYADGGTNEVMSLMNWNSDTYLTVYEASYTEIW